MGLKRVASRLQLVSDTCINIAFVCNEINREATLLTIYSYLFYRRMRDRPAPEQVATQLIFTTCEKKEEVRGSWTIPQNRRPRRGIGHRWSNLAVSIIAQLREISLYFDDLKIINIL